MSITTMQLLAVIFGAVSIGFSFGMYCHAKERSLFATTKALKAECELDIKKRTHICVMDMKFVPEEK